MERDSTSREVLFEFTQVGGVVKVAAIDATTGFEVSIAAPAHAPQSALKALALRKLRVRLAAESP